MQKKRLTCVFSLLCLWCVSLLAQPAEGFYRVQNTTTKRYITVVNNTMGGSATNPDLSALTTVSGYDNVVSNPASILYFKKVGSQYDMIAQGVDTYQLTGYHFNITGSSSGYEIGASVSMFSFKLSDGDGTTGTSECNISGSNEKWKFIPVTQDNNQYFGFKPEYEVGGRYFTTFYATFGFEPVSPGIKVYALEKTENGTALMKEQTGPIRGYQAVIIECASANPANNKVRVINGGDAGGGAQLPNNQLRGVLFNKGGNLANQTYYNSNTMRVLGITQDGRIGMVKARYTTLPANKAYLTVSESLGDEIPLMTYEEYEEAAGDAITIRIKDAERFYYEPNPTFEYTIEGGTPVGTPTLYCDASILAPVGTYDIKARKGKMKNSKIEIIPGTLTIKPVQLTVWTSPITRLQGDPNPDQEIMYSGFRNHEDESVFFKKPTLDFGADENSPVGTYTVVPAGGDAQNYTFKYIPTTLEVVERQLTAIDFTREYGEPNPIFDYEPKVKLTGEPEIYTEAMTDSPVGEYDIVIAQGTIEGEGIDFVNGTLTITPAPLTIKADDMTRVEGEPNPDFTASYIGFKNGEDATALEVQPKFVCEADENSMPGTYPIYVEDAVSQNYNISYIVGSLTVTEAPPVTVTAKSYTREYGEENPTLEYTSDGAQIFGTPDVSCEATATSPVGTYPIVISKGEVTNHNDTYVNGTLTITPATLTISGGEYTIQQGEELPVLTAVYQGFKNNETEDVLTKKPVLTTTAVKGCEPGTYEVAVSGAEAQNYVINYVSGTLTVIEAASVVVTATSLYREYGEENPELQFTAEGATLEGEPQLSCEATATSPVGTYDIVIGKGSVTNYNDTYVNGTLTITPATLTVGVKDVEIAQGDELPVFELTYQGWKNDDNESVLTSLPVATTAATSDSPVGEYEISISGGEAQNYVFTYTVGKLTVKEASGINSIMADGDGVFDVYTTSGVKVRSRATSLDGLPKGVYVVKMGRKYLKLKN